MHLVQAPRQLSDVTDVMSFPKNCYIDLAKALRRNLIKTFPNYDFLLLGDHTPFQCVTSRTFHTTTHKLLISFEYVKTQVGQKSRKKRFAGGTPVMSDGFGPCLCTLPTATMSRRRHPMPGHVYRSTLTFCANVSAQFPVTNFSILLANLSTYPNAYVLAAYIPPLGVSLQWTSPWSLGVSLRWTSPWSHVTTNRGFASSQYVVRLCQASEQSIGSHRLTKPHSHTSKCQRTCMFVHPQLSC